MSKRTGIAWALVILWMAIIFMLSHQPASVSSSLSNGITETIIKAIEKVMPGADFDIRDFHYIVRKNAHFIAYFVLGALTVNALRKSGIHGFRNLAFSFCVCVLYAISDEMHQLFIPGRSGEARDVLIDSAGACVGIGVFSLLTKFCSKKKKENYSLNKHSIKRT